MEERSSDQILQDYLEGNLEGEALQAFENRLETDNALAEEVRTLRALNLGLEGAGADALFAEIKAWEQTAGQQRRSVPLRRILSIAAAVAIVASVGLFLFRPQPSTPDLFSTYYAPYQNMLTSRDGRNELLLTQGMAAYDQQNYVEAVQKLTEYVAVNDAQASARLYLGISQLEIDDISSAIENFQIISQHQLVGQQAQWYRSLALLKSKDLESATRELEAIALEKGHYQHKKARELLEKL